MDVEPTQRALEAVDKELAAFVEKRAKSRETANREEESWKAPTRRRRRQERRENALAWADHYASMARVHHGLAAECAEKADAVLEQLERNER